MDTPRDPPHYLRKLKTTTVPSRLLWLDCATQHTKQDGAYVQRWLAGALGETHWTAKKHDRKDTLDTFTEASALWQRVDELCRKNRRQVMFAYDLALQMRVSEALVHLPAMGWELKKIVLERTAAWALLHNDGKTLMMCDLRSWTTATLAQLAADVNGGKRVSFDATAGREYQAKVCRERCQYVRDVTLQLLEWIESENLGPFRPTGSGQSYAAFRRRFLTHNLLVHDDRERLAVERRAMWTGRCEAWRHGTLTDGPYVEYDMQAAYCRIAAERGVPTLAMPAQFRLSLDKLMDRLDKYCVLAEVEITTDVPCVPTRHGGRTVWPVGTFTTALWDPELELAMRYASRLKVLRTYVYRREPALQAFAEWVLAGMGSQTQIYGLTVQRALKHWSRCLVGRLGLRFRAWEDFGTQPDPDLRLVTVIDPDDGTSTDMLIAGVNRMILADMSEATDSLPQIPSWVMSECRRRLWDAMVRLGLGSVVYVDTDSVVFAQPWDDDYRHAAVEGGSPSWDLKGTYSRMVIHGPRNLVCEADRRVAGLPKTARQVAPLEFTGEVMQSLRESMRNGELDCVTSLPRRFILDAPDLRRQHLSNGLTAPFEVQPTIHMEG